jgi:hypothetical protein
LSEIIDIDVMKHEIQQMGQITGGMEPIRKTKQILAEMQ